MNKEKNKSQTSSSGIEVEGKTVEDAIQKGLEILGLPREKVEIKILDEGTSGLFGLMGSKSAKVRLQPKQSIKKIEFNSDMGKFLKKCIVDLIGLMGLKRQKYEIEVKQEQDVVQVNLSFPEEKTGSLLIGKNGKTLQALNTVVQSIFNHKYKDSQNKPPRISIDINNYNLRQEQKIKDIVNRAIKIVSKTKKPYTLQPMNPRMRRFVHLILKDSKEFQTVSEGEGANRRVVIKPKSDISV